MHRSLSRGSAAPLALLFTLVSMSFTVAYLKNSFSQSAMEKYRYAEWKALYAAEAGLNDVGIVVLPYLVSDTLLLTDGVNYGRDENNRPIGMYKDIACSTQLLPNSTRKEYIAYSTGVADYITPSGTNVSIERRVFTSMRAQGFEEYMYFTHEEYPIGPGNTGTVNFGPNDNLEGKVHTNGVMTMSNWGCPDFSGEVNVTFEAIEENGNAINYGSCDEGDLFEDDDGNTILDTVSQIIYPPDNSAEIAKNNATRTFEADGKLFRPGKKDTLIMTEINFVEGGYWATQWTYNIPPVGNPPSQFNYLWDGVSTGVNVMEFGLRTFPSDFDEETNSYNPNFFILDGITLDGISLLTLLENGDFDINTGDQILVYNDDNTKVLAFTATGWDEINDNVTVQLLPETVSYNGPEGVGFDHGENVTFVNTSASDGLNDDFEWNNHILYHDHDRTQLDPDGWTGYCEAGGRQHFDFDYWTAGGTSCDIFTCPDEIYNSEHVYMSRSFFALGNAPEVIYVKGGQVLVRGTVSGKYTIVTDDYTEYRVHSGSNAIDRVWGNIWLIDDVVYSDSQSSGEIIHPSNGGSNNVLGLISGGSVIIANTLPNGARSGGTGSGNIKINAAILAMNGGFISHYWQNTTVGYSGPSLASGYDNLPIADGRGGHRNNYRHEDVSGLYSSNNQGDYRGYVRLWGSVVQYRRGYMKRNATGPYMTGDIGYDKDYNYDWNLQLNPPPYFPDLQSTNNSVILKMASYGEARNHNQD